MTNLPGEKILGYKSKNNSGQALLIVLLMMAVVLTMVLSVVSRSVTDIQLTTKDDETLRAFSAAEAGIESALIVGEDVTSDPDFSEHSTFDAIYSGHAEGSVNYLIPEDFYAGESGTVWFVSHDPDNVSNLTCTAEDPCFNGTRMDVCFGNYGTSRTISTTPAIEVTVYYDESGSTALGPDATYGDVKVARKSFDASSLRSDNGFEVVTQGCFMTENANLFAFHTGQINFASEYNIPCAGTEGCLLFARIKYFYSYANATSPPHPLGVRVYDDTLPAQGPEIDSIGTSGGSTVEIVDISTYREQPSVFDSAIFSLGESRDLTK